MKKQLKSVIVLLCICSIIAVLLALTNSFTAPIIEESKKAAANEALLVVMPEGKGFSEVDLSAYTLPATVVKAYKEANGRGYVFELETTGYGSGFRIMCGVSAEGIVTGAVCLSSNETLGHEKTYGDNFKGKDADAVSKVDTISSATKTTAAYRQAVTDALNSAIILGGGSVDIRTEEEILRDNLTAALPAGEGKFTRLFITEVLDGVSAVYVADNGKGMVLVMGEISTSANVDIVQPKRRSSPARLRSMSISRHSRICRRISSPYRRQNQATSSLRRRAQATESRVATTTTPHQTNIFISKLVSRMTVR